MLGVAVATGTFCTTVALLWKRGPDANTSPAAIEDILAIAPIADPVTEVVPIGRGDTLDTVLGRIGMDSPGRMEMISAVQSVFDVRKFRAGSRLTLKRGSDGIPDALQYVIDADHELDVSRSGGSFQASVVEVPAEIRVLPIRGTMQGSLFESIERVGEKATLAIRMAAVFAWDLDFYTDPQPGDGFCLVVEKKQYENGQPPTYGRILAARYDNAGTAYEGYLFTESGGEAHYYSADGRSLESAFLRSPLKFEARVSSHFSMRRFHPLLKLYRPHLGTDYAAPVGTPVQAVASGQVTFSGRSRGSGNMIRIRHKNGYRSLYLHLFRRFVRAGERVTQTKLMPCWSNTAVIGAAS